MPSQAAHFPKETYLRIVETKGEEQSISNRIRELTEKGLIYEEEHEH